MIDFEQIKNAVKDVTTLKHINLTDITKLETMEQVIEFIKLKEAYLNSEVNTQQ